MQYQNAARPRSTIKIAKLILQESGSYNPMFSRPYQTYVDAENMNNILRRVEESKGGVVTGALLAGVAGNMISPSATPQGEIPIPMSWAERRIRFLLEVHVTVPTGSDMIYYFQGYTSHLGVGVGGAVDPQMDFILNSYIRVTRMPQYGPYGTTIRDVVTESAHIVNGALVHQVGGGEVYKMRPADIFTGIQSAYLNNAYQGFNNNDTLFDTRVRLDGESMRSNRNNNIAGNFIAKVVDTYQTGRQLIDLGQGEQDVYARCQNMTHEASAYENPFIRAISNIKGTHCSTNFSFSNLLSIDPDLEHVTQYITLGVTQMAQLHQLGQTSYWNGTDRETVAATILSNAVPAVMMDLMLSKVYFRATNHDIAGAVNIALIDGKSMTNADLSMNFEMFKRRLEKEILFDLTYGNQALFTLEMSIDLFGETRISIALESGPMISYTTPSFCDSLLTPVISMNKDNFFGVVHDFETLMNNLPQGNTNNLVNSLV